MCPGSCKAPLDAREANVSAQFIHLDLNRMPIGFKESDLSLLCRVKTLAWLLFFRLVEMQSSLLSSALESSAYDFKVKKSRLLWKKKRPGS